MKKIYLIGIGPGDPEYLTVQAINTMKRVKRCNPGYLKNVTVQVMHQNFVDAS